MKTFLFATVLSTGLFHAAPATAQETPASPEGVSGVGFMVGCWAEPGPDGTGLRETFTPPASNMLTGLSQFWRNGQIVDFEFHRIDASPNGPVLTPHPQGVASVSFQPFRLTSDRIVWQNLEHDFPQRIIYHRTAVDTLAVRVEGGEGTSARALEWRMARVPCANEEIVPLVPPQSMVGVARRHG